jgi:type VII secretion protein EccB
MTGRTTSGIQVSGYRFLVRRTEHALVRGDVRMLDDPLRAQSLSLVAGCVLAAIAVAVCAIVAFLRPSGDVGSATIVMARESGALYVRIGDTMHPALNLASARLITGVADEPELVSASALDRAERGPLVGIPGAPDTIATPLGADESVWTVCEDTTESTTVLAGQTSARLDGSQSALVTARGESAAMTYLLYDGRRARLDLRNHAVVHALELGGVVPRPVSRVLLDALPEAPGIAPPSVPGLGAPSVLPGLPIGTVVGLTRAGSAEYYVALADGVQRVGEVAADLIRFTYSLRRDIVTVAPSVIGHVPSVRELPVATFPDRGGVTDKSVLCTQPGAVLVGDSLPADGERVVVELAQADDGGPAVDRFVMPPGRSAFVRAAGLSGAGAATGAQFLVNDAGVLFGIRDADAAERLGLANPVPAPWALLAHLPRGPELSVQSASIERDGVGPTP